MKKSLALICALALCLALCACGGSAPKASPTEAPATEAPATEAPAPTEAPEPEPTDTPEPEPTDTPEPEPTETPEPVAETDGLSDWVTHGAPEGLDQAVDYADYTEESAPLGVWVKMAKKNYVDGNIAECYFRVVEVTADPEVVARELAHYRDNGGLYDLGDQPEDEELEYRVLSYEFYFPEDFNSTGGTISNNKPFSLGIGKEGPGGWEINGKTYIFVPGKVDLGTTRDSVCPGDVYHGKILFTMFRGFEGTLRFSEMVSVDDNYVTFFVSER